MNRRNNTEIYRDRSTLRPRNPKGNLLSSVLLTVEDFQAIYELPYEQFLAEVIAITNDNGGAIDRNYFNQKAYWKGEIAIAIPFKYTSKRAGSNYIGFNKAGGLSNGELLYNLAPHVKSNSVDYFYFQGLSTQKDGTYKLELTYDSW